MHLVTTVAWPRTWPSIVLDLRNQTTAAQRPQRAMQTVLWKRPPITSNNMHRGRNCCTTHVAKATKVCVLGTRLHLPRGATPRTTTNCFIFIFLCLPRRYAAAAAVTVATQASMHVSNLHEVSVSEDIFKFCVRPFGGRLRPQHIGLLLPAGTLPYTPTCNRGVVQHMVFDRFGFAQPHKCSSKATTRHANSTMQVASNGI